MCILFVCLSNKWFLISSTVLFFINHKNIHNIPHNMCIMWSPNIGPVLFVCLLNITYFWFLVLFSFLSIQNLLHNYTNIHNIPPNMCIMLNHWGRVTHICVSKLTIIGSDNGLAPGRRQTIIWTNDGILLIGPIGTNFSEILIIIQTFSFEKMHLKISSAKWRPFCHGLNVLSLNTGPVYTRHKRSHHSACTYSSTHRCWTTDRNSTEH